MRLARKVDDVPDVGVGGERLAAFSGAVDHRQPMVEEEGSVEAGDVGVGLDDGSGVDCGQSVLLVNDSVGEDDSPRIVLVEEEGVSADSVVLLLNEVGDDVGVVGEGLVEIVPLLADSREGVVGALGDLQVVA